MGNDSLARGGGGRRSGGVAALLLAVTGLASSTLASDRAELERRLASTSGTERVELLVELCQATGSEDPAGSTRFGEDALALARSLGARLGQAEALYCLGGTALGQERHAEALDLFRDARELYRQLRRDDLEGLALRRMGDAYYRLARYDPALASYLDALRRLEARAATQADRVNVAHLYTTVGNVFRQTDDREKALEYYRRALRAYQEEADELSTAGALANIGSVLQEAGRREEALDNFTRALSTAERLGNDYLRTLAMTNAGAVHMELGHHDRAMALFAESARVCERVGRTRGVLSNLLRMGDCLYAQRRFGEAVERYTAARALARQLEAEDRVAEALKGLSLSLEGLGRYQEAVARLKEYGEARGRVLDEAKTRQVHSLEVAYQSERKDQEIELLRWDRVIQRLQRRNLTVGLSLSAVVILLLGLGYWLQARARRRIEELSRTDPLTGLPNRRGLAERIADELPRSVRSGRPFVVAVVDLDRFKQVNDAGGHDAGDEVLVAVARLLRGSLRTQDVVGRWGGDEFLVLLPETDLDGGQVIAERLRAEVEVAALPGTGRCVDVTLSAGLAEGTGMEEMDHLLKRADQALYLAKQAGRNRVVAAAVEIAAR